MKTIALTVVLSSLFLLPTIVFSSDNQTQLLQESRQSVKQFASSLKGELKAAMKKGGPVNAIQVCNERAIPITDTASQKNGVTLSRTSLKIRNPANVAEAWEHKILQNFEDRKNNGESPKKMEFSEIIEIDGKKQFRYMKAMAISQPCLHCHGEKALPDVEKKLSSLYPQDKARGYKLGDIRGAIVLVKDL